MVAGKLRQEDMRIGGKDRGQHLEGGRRGEQNTGAGASVVPLLASLTIRLCPTAVSLNTATCARAAQGAGGVREHCERQGRLRGSTAKDGEESCARMSRTVLTRRTVGAHGESPLVSSRKHTGLSATAAC